MLVNPYQTVNWEKVGRWKGNLHTHTTMSGSGTLSPHQTIDEYHRRGYTVLALTDHNRVTFPWTALRQLRATNENRDPSALGMLAVAGSELTRHHHMLSLFSDFKTESKDLDQVLDSLASYSSAARAVLCHPAMHWLQTFADHPGVKVAMAKELRTVTRGEFSVEVWFRTTDTGRNVLVGNYSNGMRGALNLELYTDNRVRMFVRSSSGDKLDINVRADPIKTRDGSWHHVAGVRKKGRMSLFLDGREIGSAEDRIGSFDLAGDAFFLGRDTRVGSTAFNGDLGTVRIWKACLSAGTIKSLASGKTLKDITEHTGEEKHVLLAEFRHETSNGASVGSVSIFTRRLDDTAKHPGGLFHAWADEAELCSVSQGLCPSRQALRFREVKRVPKVVPELAVDFYAALFKSHRHLCAMEVANGTRPLSEYRLDQALWDALLARLMPSRPIWGMASDDMHELNELGVHQAVFLTDRLDENSIRNALDQGSYYFSTKRVRAEGAKETATTPQLDRITHDAESGLISVSASAAGKPLGEDAYTWISMGKPIQHGRVLDYRKVSGIGSYVRAEITCGGGTTYTNPFGFSI